MTVWDVATYASGHWLEKRLSSSAQAATCQRSAVRMVKADRDLWVHLLLPLLPEQAAQDSVQAAFEDLSMMPAVKDQKRDHGFSTTSVHVTLLFRSLQIVSSCYFLREDNLQTTLEN